MEKIKVLFKKVNGVLTAVFPTEIHKINKQCVLTWNKNGWGYENYKYLQFNGKSANRKEILDMCFDMGIRLGIFYSNLEIIEFGAREFKESKKLQLA